MSTKQFREDDVGRVVRDAVTRSLAVVGLLGVALIHVLDAHDTFVSNPYQGWLYLALIAGCLTTAVALVRGIDPRAWLAGMLLPLGAMLAYAYSRTIGLPNDASDIGNWWQTLGVASLFVEGALVSLCAAMYTTELRPKTYSPRLAAIGRPDLDRGVR
jgi:hypothetical protein